MQFQINVNKGLLIKMKKAIGIFLILMLVNTSSVFASQIKTLEEVGNATYILEKYSEEFTEMENDLKEMELKLNSNYYDLKEDDLGDKVITRTIREDNDLIILGIAYSTTWDGGIYDTKQTTHAKLWAKSSWEEQNGTHAALRNVQRKVLEIYDGAVCAKIEITAGQGCAWQPGSEEFDSFETTRNSYNKNYDWPLILWVPEGISDLGHTSTFTIERGTVYTYSFYKSK